MTRLARTFEGQDPLAFIALILGPLMMASGLLFVGFEFHQTAKQLRAHVDRIAIRDQRWDPIISDVQQNTRDIATSVKEKVDSLYSQQGSIVRTLDQIVGDQKELIALVQGKKIGELLSSKSKHNRFTGDFLSESTPNSYR